MKCRVEQVCSSSHRCTTGALWVDRLSQITWTAARVRPAVDLVQEVQEVQEVAEVDGAVPLRELADDLAGGGVQGGEQVYGAVPHVVEAVSFGDAGHHRRTGAVRSRAWICGFSSTEKTAAFADGAR